MVLYFKGAKVGLDAVRPKLLATSGVGNERGHHKNATTRNKPTPGSGSGTELIDSSPDCPNRTSLVPPKCRTQSSVTQNSADSLTE
jgi:hypothetical protein